MTTIQSIIHKCPNELKEYVADLFKVAIKLAEYDPNYIYAENDEEMVEDAEEGGWGSDFEDDN